MSSRDFNAAKKVQTEPKNFKNSEAPCIARCYTYIVTFTVVILKTVFIGLS